ncbi:2-hydroxymuconate tautomerase [Neptuniibacter sp.]|uniref:2-hydroxymuconate tautomerase n=1 Tax=Neptuniibacter sp. TaxID=1962643 RepID=UPI002603EBB5|nr:2-hydroxymuconate tautomerase [Neptuniibacter sp.]MCP4597385.1 4-oxalocrotonate tautomerase family protein [Neptuniibacter sp.]
MPIANIQMMEGRTPEQKAKLIRKVTDAIMESLDAPEGNVRVLINEIPKPHFGIGGQSADKLGR